MVASFFLRDRAKKNNTAPMKPRKHMKYSLLREVLCICAGVIKHEYALL